LAADYFHFDINFDTVLEKRSEGKGAKLNSEHIGNSLFFSSAKNTAQGNNVFAKFVDQRSNVGSRSQYTDVMYLHDRAPSRQEKGKR